ncbi:hypothetical protein [Chondromyces apiculatus]|uniref:hypothetical protein n=1 Tax=Chondromyces apiculatus TaxID=51 RepID=UPI0012DCD687|nr:hypothetical protein [Chondromyces apiculatus]
MTLGLVLAGCSKSDPPAPSTLNAPSASSATPPSSAESAQAASPSAQAAPPSSSAPSEGAPALSVAPPVLPDPAATPTQAAAPPTANASAAAASPSAAAASPSATAASPSAGALAGTPAGTSPAPAAALAGASAALPKAPGGILGPGEADRFIKTGARPTVKLLHAGADPQAELTYAFTKGKYPVGTRIDMSMGLSIGGKALPATKVPRIVMLMDAAVGDRDPRGEMRVEGTVRSLDADAQADTQKEVLDVMQSQLGMFKGLGMTYLVSPKGYAHDFAVKLPPGVPEQAQQMLSGLSQSFESMVAPFPNEPVGAGARWQVVTRVNNAGADIVQFATYTLKSRAGDRATLDIKIDQLAASATVAAPGLPPGASARLTSFKSGGGGSSTVDLKNLIPVSSTMSLQSGMEIDITGGPGGGGGKARIDMTMRAETFRPAK